MESCSICGHSEGNRTHSAREMMFGFRDRFTYLECAGCGCLQLQDPPADLSRYYPAGYYSFSRHGRAKTFLRHQWSAQALRGRNPFGAIIQVLHGPNTAMQAVRRLNPPRGASILDVGCGSGQLILDLFHLGYTGVTGLDPYLERDLVHDNGVTVLKRRLDDMEGRFDVIMLHHSFEHMPEPLEVMKNLSRLLHPKGCVILRIPVCSSHAWRHYGVDWMHLDAPRHLYLHSSRSIELLAAAAGLAVEDVVHEGNASQFLGSEQYRRDIPLMDRRSFSASPAWRLWRWFEVRRLEARAEELNRRGEGDLVSFELRHAGHLR